MPLFDLQGHRGARGLRPENTLPAFEIALDLGVTSIETDLHLTSDHVTILFHDERVSERLCRRGPICISPHLRDEPLVSTLTLSQMRGYLADRNPDPQRFPKQDASVSPLASRFAELREMLPYTPPTLEELFAFTAAYAGKMGAKAGKTAAQRKKAKQVRFHLELKRVPFYPEAMGDEFDGDKASLLEEQVVEVTRAADMRERTNVISFDHRCLRAVRRLEPRLTTTVLIANTAPVSPGELVRQADAQGYGPDYLFLDERQVKQLHAEGILVVPWTVNERRDWERLLDWGVDGIATDFPDRLAELLRERGVDF